MCLNAVGGVGSSKETTGQAFGWRTSSEADRAVWKIQHNGPYAYTAFFAKADARCAAQKGPPCGQSELSLRLRQGLLLVSARVRTDGDPQGTRAHSSLLTRFRRCSP